MAKKSKNKAEDTNLSSEATGAKDAKGNAGKGKNLKWKDNRHWTDRAIAYLTTHPTFRAKLFSDSNADAAKEGRSKLVGKDSKTQLIGQLAEHIFSTDDVEAEGYKAKPARYATSVETRLRRLKEEYQTHVKTLGSTGAGVLRKDIQPGSELESLRNTIDKAFPWFDELHAFWRDLPHYNPICITTSTPGANHAASAIAAFEPVDKEESESERKDEDADEDDEEDENEDADAEDSAEKSTTPAPEATKKASPPAGASTAGPAPKKSNSKEPAGRDAGTTKGKAAQNNKLKQQQAVDKIQDWRIQQSERADRKREMEHEREMERLRAKKAKYDFKRRQADIEQENRQKEKEERDARDKLLQQQLEMLARRLDQHTPNPSQPPQPSNSGLYYDAPSHYRSESEGGFTSDGFLSDGLSMSDGMSVSNGLPPGAPFRQQ